MGKSAGRAASVMAAAVLLGCPPKAPPLTGVETRPALPSLEVPPGHTRFVFDWRYEDPDMRASGEGAARSAYPDSARVDFFLQGGLGSGAAVLVGQELRAPGPAALRRLVPPPPLLWAALGRLAVPPAADTSARLDGDTLRVDIGRGDVWRVTIAGAVLARLERIESGRITQSLHRVDDRRVRYYEAGARRSLELTVTRVDRNVEHDPSIWSL
jgi:hypothetical protein